MNNPTKEKATRASNSDTPAWLIPLKIAGLAVHLRVAAALQELAVLPVSAACCATRIESTASSSSGMANRVYLHPMVWGSLVLFFVAKSSVFSPGWPLLIWFIMLTVCFLTVMYNFDIFKAGILLVSLVAVFGLAYISNMEWHWNPLRGLAHHIRGLERHVSPPVSTSVACYVFAVLIFAEVVWAWLFNRVELDESYVYEHQVHEEHHARADLCARAQTGNQRPAGTPDPRRRRHRAPHEDRIQTIPERARRVARIGPGDRLDAGLSPQRASRNGTQTPR